MGRCAESKKVVKIGNQGIGKKSEKSEKIGNRENQKSGKFEKVMTSSKKKYAANESSGKFPKNRRWLSTLKKSPIPKMYKKHV